LIYALLHLSGYDLDKDELRNFRQLGSKTPGHPEFGHTDGVETTTGPLGQGLATAVGMAIAERYLASHFNRDGFDIFDHNVWTIASDGDLMEGVAAEASSMAGHLRLAKLKVFWDDNRISIEGSTDLAFTEDVLVRYRSYGWATFEIEDVEDLDAVAAVLEQAAESERPVLVRARTRIGYGSPKQDTAASHGAPLGADGVKATKEKLGWPLEPTFHVPQGALDTYAPAIERGKADRAAWLELLERYRAAHPELAATLDAWRRRELPTDWDAGLPTYDADHPKIATRKASGAALTALAAAMPQLLGGSADLAGSNNTFIKGRDAQSADAHGGGNFHFGVREHAMGAAMNGMALHGGIVPYAGTFLVFSDYCRPSIRLSALMEQRVIYVMTHDS
ncbi:MAG: transketolase, partial [Acidobacteriota bacterium]